MISIIITSFNEPNLERAIKSVLDQKINYKHKIIIVAPDKEAEKLTKKYKIKYFKDPGKGKSYALNLLLKKLKSDILILTDGDVYLANNSINNIMELFKDQVIGVVSGRPVPEESKNYKWGYFANLLFYGAHRIRKKLFLQGKFLECSGYLFAFRNIIKEFPLDVAEDTIIPYIFSHKGYKIGYSEKALVYVKNPTNFKDWIKQKKRTAKGHETLKKYYPNFPRVKSFSNEIKYGFFWALGYPTTIRQMYWTILLIFYRLYLWIITLTEAKLLKKDYKDAWERVNSTK